MVGFELEVLSKKVDRFGWERDRGSAVQNRIFKDWMDTLQDYPLDEIQAACAAAMAANPNRVPNEQKVKAEIIKARKKVVQPASQPMQAEPPKKRVTAEQATSILEQAGFSVRRFG